MKSLTNLEFNKGGNKFNSIVSRETLGETKQISEFYEENGTAKYIVGGEVKEIGNGDKQTLYTIKSTKWQPITNTGSYKFKVTLKLPFEVGELDIVMLANTNTLLFEKFGISAINLGVDSVDIICRKQPTEDINVKLIFSKAKIAEVPIVPTSASLFTFEGTACTGYIGDNNVEQIVIPRSYSKKTEMIDVVGAKIINKEKFISDTQNPIRRIEAIQVVDGLGLSKRYDMENIQNLTNDFKGDCYISMYVTSELGAPPQVPLEQVKALLESGVLEYPLYLNDMKFDDPTIAGKYAQDNRIYRAEFAFNKTEEVIVDGNDYQVDSVGVADETSGVSGFNDYTGTVVLLDNIEAITLGAFYKCTLIEHIDLSRCSKLTTIGFVSIFACWKITEIIIPLNVNNLEDNSLGSNTALNNITYQGTIEQWNAIQKGARWNDVTPAQVVHCTDGDAPIGGV